MTKFYLEFEKPLKVIDEKIKSLSSMTDLKQDDISSLSKLKEERTLLIREIYSICHKSNNYISLSTQGSNSRRRI